MQKDMKWLWNYGKCKNHECIMMYDDVGNSIQAIDKAA